MVVISTQHFKSRPIFNGSQVAPLSIFIEVVLNSSSLPIPFLSFSTLPCGTCPPLLQPPKPLHHFPTPAPVPPPSRIPTSNSHPNFFPSMHRHPNTCVYTPFNECMHTHLARDRRYSPPPLPYSKRTHSYRAFITPHFPPPNPHPGFGRVCTAIMLCCAGERRGKKEV